MGRRLADIRVLGAKLAGQARRPLLLVDDNPVALRILEQLLGQLGLEAETAAGPEAALALVTAAHAPDYLACLVDWRMPEMDGVELIRRLRAIYADRRRDKAPPMILVTAYSHLEELQDVERQVDGLLGKPVCAKPLYLELARCLGAVDGDAPVQERRRAGEHWSRFRDLDVLVVEDMDVNREVIQQLLAQVGISSRSAVNGAEALAEIERRTPDLVLMDCQMPVMDGFTATRRLRERSAWRHLPIIALTANAMPEDREQCFGAGMNAYVPKPIRMEALFERMVQCLPDAGAHAPPLPTPAEPAPYAPLPLLAGIDLPLALAQVGGRVPLLLRVLGQFRDNLGRTFAEQFATARAAADWETRRRLAHSLQGVAHTLGALDLAAAAVLLHKAVKEQDADRCDAALAQVLEQLGSVVGGLGVLEEWGAAEDPMASLDR
jgi:CheY-like chemotaxis protein